MDILNLKRKKILITGASGGIGMAISKRIIDCNGIPIMHYHTNKEKVFSFIEKAGQEGKEAYTVQFDICDEAAIKASIKDLKTKFHSLDGLINNAGVLSRGFIPTHSMQTLKQVVDINMLGNFCVMKHVSQLMMTQKYGNIINMSSLAGKMGLKGQAAYSMSKAGINALTRIAAKELAAYNIRVNAVAPGYVQTGMLENPTENDKTYIQQIPLKRYAQDYEVANAVIFLLSEASSYITGQSLIIDGGLSISL